ncbi:hypothetical protein V5799_008442 [Amblyomma americanum]|uniref:Secreted protein n=1 Tax=Amblyomma americanum TaxID=6943 RepID=A0AAQ4FEF1_AMBAM
MMLSVFMPSLLVVFTIIVEGSEWRPVHLAHLRCVEPCDPWRPQPPCPSGCLCHPKKDFPFVGSCLNPRLPRPPEWGHPLISAPIKPVYPSRRRRRQ